MKFQKTFFLAIFIFIGLTAAAQTSFSCFYREYCPWNEYREQFEECEGYDDASLFVINEAETMFTHTTESMKSTYYVMDKDYDEENDIWYYKVTSDVGNEYDYYFDPIAKEIRVIYTRDRQTKLLRFYVKAVF